MLAAHHIFHKLSPFQIVKDLGLEIEEKHGSYLTTHPKDEGHSLLIAESQFVGFPNGPTPGCNVVEFLAMHFGSYSQAIDHIFQRYDHLIALPVGCTWGEVREQLAEALKTAREQFETILSLQRPLRSQSQELLDGFMYCHRKNLDPQHIWRMLYIVRGAQLNRVLQCLPKPVRPFDGNETYLVLPYFQDFCRFARLEICNLHDNLLKTIPVNSCQHMIFGLHGCYAGQTSVQVAETPHEAAKLYSASAQWGEYRGFVHIRFHPEEEPHQSPLQSGRLLVSEHTDFQTVINSRKVFKRLEVIDPKGRFTDAEPQPVIEKTQKALVRPTPVPLKAQQLFIVNGAQVAETAAGYVVTEPGTKLNCRFTNFVIRVESRIWFEERQQTYLHGWIRLRNDVVPFSLLNSHAHRAEAILLEAQRAVDLVADLGLPLPTILDSVHKSKLVDIVHQQLGGTGKRVGVDTLGWNPNRTRFITPAWQVNKDGLEPTSKVFHPKAETLRQYFSAADYKLSEGQNLLTPQARFLITLVAASLGRGFLNLPAQPIKILRSPQSFALLQSVFRPLGQILPIDLGVHPQDLRQLLLKGNLRRYPLFASSANPKGLDGLNFPLFLLGRSGTSLMEPLISSDARLQITSLAHRVITAIVKQLIRAPGQAQQLFFTEQAPSIDHLASEGLRLMEYSGVAEGFARCSGAMPLLEQVLSRIRPEEAYQFFSHDPARKIISIRCRAIHEWVTRMPLYYELAAQNAEVKYRGRHYLEVPADWFLDLLEKQFGRPIILLPRSSSASSDKPQSLQENEHVNAPTMDSASDLPQQI